METFRPLRFEYIVYPVWRRRLPAWLRPLAEAVLPLAFPVDADRQPPRSPEQMARYLSEWEIMDWSPSELVHQLTDTRLNLSHANPNAEARIYNGDPLRIPAQWEQTERALISWGNIYPPLWPMHATMAEAISHVATCEILVPDEWWGRAVWIYLLQRGYADMSRIQVLVLPTDDIWIRDYGPVMARTRIGQRVAVNPPYAVLPQYPQARDNSMTELWAAHHDIPVLPFDLHTEGGNLWSDGLGTLIMSEQIFYSNRYYDRDRLLRYLHRVFDFEKLIITPRLTLEETGHVDLLVKLGAPDLVFVSAATSLTTAQALRKTRRLFERERNAQDQPYRVVELPTPPLYLNWFSYTIRRSYTNALTINGRVLVPVFGLASDDLALQTYAAHLPDHEIIPIDSRIGINGGGAVHCMTKEIPI